MAGRTMKISHKGMNILIKERNDNSVILAHKQYEEHTDKKFPQACRYALTWLLENAGEMRGNYDRD